MIELIMLAVIAIVGLTVFGGIIALILMYNNFIGMKNRIDNAWAQIDVQTKKRYDLIPNLVETIKGYAKHEKSVFENVTKARSAAMGAQNMADKAKSENMLTNTLKSLFAVAENYPDLKANQNFLMLQEELSGIESKIAYARQFYNDTVMRFNQATEMFPSSIVAGIFGFKAREYFQAAEAERKAVKVKF